MQKKQPEMQITLLFRRVSRITSSSQGHARYMPALISMKKKNKNKKFTKRPPAEQPLEGLTV